MLKRMVGCAFSSGGGNSRASGGSTSTTSTVQTSPQPNAVASEPRRAPAGAARSDQFSSTGVAAPAPAWASPHLATREELEARRVAERKFITANDSTETDVWYLIDVDWLSDWKRFVLRSGTVPGPIRNDTLIDPRTGKPRPGLELVVNYRGVNAGIWRYWVQRYGGGPIIRRHTLDLYTEPVADMSFGADSALEDADEPLDLPQQLLAQRALSGPGCGHMVPLSTSSYEASGTSSGASERAADNPGKASSRRSFIPDLLKGYRGGGRSAGKASNVPTKQAASETSAAPAATSAREKAQAPRSKDVMKATDVGGDAGATSSTCEGENDGMNFFVRDGEACVVAQPMDGSCLFHSLSYGIDDGSDAHSLRADISNYIAGNPDMVIAGTALKDWIKFDSGGKVAAYAAEMAGGTWGGGIEIEAFVQLKDVNVHVFESCPGGYRRICRFDTVLGDCRTVSLLYQGREHYDALVIDDAAGSWVPRTDMTYAGA